MASRHVFTFRFFTCCFACPFIADISICFSFLLSFSFVLLSLINSPLFSYYFQLQFFLPSVPYPLSFHTSLISPTICFLSSPIRNPLLYSFPPSTLYSFLSFLYSPLTLVPHPLSLTPCPTTPCPPPLVPDPFYIFYNKTPSI